MTLYLHRAERTDLLADELAGLLAAPAADPFAPELVAVPTKGVERFLSQRLALRLGTDHQHGDGVCANVLFPAPDQILDASAIRAAGRDPATDPWRVTPLSWHIARVMCAALDEAWAQPVRVFLRDDPSPAEALASRNVEHAPADPADPTDPTDPADPWRGSGRVLALAGRLAELFHAYDLERPAMVRAWATGAPAEVPDDLLWQFHLWAAVRDELAIPSLGEVLDESCATLAAEPDAAGLPQRLSLFGPTRIPHAHLAVLRALGEQRDVHVWLPDPSPRRWDRITAVAAELDRARPLRRDVTLPTRHPLLRSLGRDSAELTYQMGSLRGGASAPEPAASPQRPDTLLGWLQSDLAADRVPAAAARADRVLRADDTSLRVHACPGRPRQVEILREVLLGMLQRDRTLEPRDILVMCPDVATFAPLVTAAFGVDDPRHRNPARELRVRIADRTREQQNPVLQALDELLTLAVERCTASQVLDFASLPVVADRFGWDLDELERIRVLVESASIRWGLDWADRLRFGLPNAQNTWAAGVDRMLLGVAMAEDEDNHILGRVLPLDDVATSDIGPVGRLAELVERLRGILPTLRSARTATQWHEVLADALTQLTSTPPWEQGLFTSALGAVGGLLTADEDPAGPRRDGVLLELGDVRHLLAGLLAGRPTRTNFRTGGLTVCSLVPMRSVPHRVVCLLGIDDGVYPRSTRVDGNDVVSRTPRLGEPDLGASDRQVLLDAVMAATEHLVIVHTGTEQHTNASRAPAVPVQELIDAVDLTATAPGGAVRERVVVRHPLQPFDPANFRPGPAGSGAPFSTDVHALAGARALAGPVSAPVPLVPGPLPAEHRSEVDLADLRRFLNDPPGFFLKERMGLSLHRDDEAPSEAMPVHLRGLARYDVGDRLLRAVLAGTSLEAAWQAECLRGTIPPGLLARQASDDLVPEVRRIAEVAGQWRGRQTRDVGVDVVLPSGIRVTGVVADVCGETAVTATFARMKEKYQLEAWLRLLALHAAEPGTDFRAGVVTKQTDGRWGVLLTAPENPVAVLDQIVDLFLRGLREPLPLTATSGERYALRRQAAAAADRVLSDIALRCWDPKPRHGNSDATEPQHVAVWGADDPFSAFLAAPPLPDEQAWFPDETTRFGVLARRLWSPLLPCRKNLR